MLRQENGYGCGVYAVANALNMKEFVTSERLEASKENGNNFAQLNKWLLEEGKNFQIQVKYFKDGVQFRTPRLKVFYEGADDLICVPALVTYNTPRCKRNHMIALSCYPDGTLHVFDSCKSEPDYYLSWDDFREHYKRIISLSGFVSFENENVYLAKQNGKS